MAKGSGDRDPRLPRLERMGQWLVIGMVVVLAVLGAFAMLMRAW